MCDTSCVQGLVVCNRSHCKQGREARMQGQGVQGAHGCPGGHNGAETGGGKRRRSCGRRTGVRRRACGGGEVDGGWGGGGGRHVSLTA